MDNKHEQLRERAYSIWQAEGEPHGRDREHWEMAERELSPPDADSVSETTAPKSTAARRKKATPVEKTEVTGGTEAKPKTRKPRAPKPA